MVERYLQRKRDAVSKLDEAVPAKTLGIDAAGVKPLREWALRADWAEKIAALMPEGEAAQEALDDASYAPYLERQYAEVAARHRDRQTAIPPSFDFALVPGLSTEMCERLAIAGPADLDQASRVQGVTPAALSALHFALARQAA